MEKDPILPIEPVPLQSEQFLVYSDYQSIGADADKRIVEISYVDSLKLAIYASCQIKLGKIDTLPIWTASAVSLTDEETAQIITNHYTSQKEAQNRATKSKYFKGRILHFLHLADEPIVPELLSTEMPTPVTFKLKRTESK